MTESWGVGGDEEKDRERTPVEEDTHPYEKESEEPEKTFEDIDEPEEDALEEIAAEGEKENKEGERQRTEKEERQRFEIVRAQLRCQSRIRRRRKEPDYKLTKIIDGTTELNRDYVCYQFLRVWCGRLPEKTIPFFSPQNAYGRKDIGALVRIQPDTLHTHRKKKLLADTYAQPTTPVVAVIYDVKERVVRLMFLSSEHLQNGKKRSRLEQLLIPYDHEKPKL